MDSIPPPDSSPDQPREVRGWYQPWHGFVVWLVLFLAGQVWGGCRWEESERRRVIEGEERRREVQEYRRDLAEQRAAVQEIKALMGARKRPE